MRFLLTIALASGLVLHGGLARADDTVPQDHGSDTREVEVDTNLPMGPILVASMGAVVLVVGAGFGWQAYEENDDYNHKSEDAEGNVVYPNATGELADDIEKHAIAANVLMFGGAATMIGGLLWWLLDDDYKSEDEKGDRAESKAVSARAVFGPGQAGLVIDF